MCGDHTPDHIFLTLTTSWLGLGNKNQGKHVLSAEITLTLKNR